MPAPPAKPPPVQPAPAAPAYAADRALAFLLGLHGLALLVVFPFGPQGTRLWHPGVVGAAALAAAFPLSAVIGGLLARRAARLPASPVALVALAFACTLPCALSIDYPTLFAARILAGLATGLSYIAIHRLLPAAAAPLVGRLAPRIVAFGMPLCLLAATVLDWHAAFVPILAGQALLLVYTARHTRSTRPAAPAPPPPSLTPPRLGEPLPLALLATGALAFVTGAYLTVLSGYLVFNAGHTELHIPASLLAGALLGLAVPALVARLRARLAPGAAFAATLAGSATTLLALLALRAPLPGWIAVTLLGCFMAANAARHLALAGLVSPRLTAADLPAHQGHAHLAHHLGSGLGAACASLVIYLTPDARFAGMPILLACALVATAAALAAGLAAAQPMASPAALAAAANSRLRVATSAVRSVLTSITRNPGSPT